MPDNQKCIKCNNPKDTAGQTPYCSRCLNEIGFRASPRLPVEMIEPPKGK